MLAVLAFAPAALAQSDAHSSQSAQGAAAAQAPVAAAKTPDGITSPPAGKAEVVYFRPAAYVGWMLGFSVHEGRTGIGKLGNGSYFTYIGDPGDHAFSIQSEATDTLHMELDPDEIYYVKASIGQGLIELRPHLTPSDQGVFALKPLKLSTKKPTDLDAPASSSKPAS
jgi:hypothetical protein